MSDDEPKAGMSTGIKILIAILVGGGVCVIACCGGGYYLARNAIKITDQPAEIVEIQELIADIQTPEGFKPKTGMTTKAMGFNMNMVVYSRDNGQQDGLVLMQFKMPGDVPEDQMKMSFENQMKTQQNGQSQNINVTETETRSFVIDDEEVEFTFSTGTQAGSDQAVRQVTGVFPSRNGTAMLMFLTNEENWDEEQVVKMIESISAK